MEGRIDEKKHLSARGLLSCVRKTFQNVTDPANGERGRKPEISITDCLMSGLAVFGLKFPSLLQFDNNKCKETIKHNLKAMYQVARVPCDTALRKRLDDVDPREVRGAFTGVFSALQRGKALKRFEFIDGHYLLLLDGTGYFSSKSVHCNHCCQKSHRDSSVTYYHMMLGAVIVHPDRKEVLPLCPEPILNQDGTKKNDCERNVSKRLIADLRREHPNLPLIVVEDALAANAPHLRLCQQHNIHFITVVKPDGNKTLFEWIKGIEMAEMKVNYGGVIKQARFYNGVPLNDADPDLKVNFIEYWECDQQGKRHYHNTWITDLDVTKENVFKIARGGRARWKVENETFNTLKNQGYNFEHNYGHGYNNLSTILAQLMFLAFLIDQAQQLCCGLFQAAWQKLGSKKSLWEHLRGAFMLMFIDSWQSLYHGLIYGLKSKLIPNTS